jgi:lysozyme family protein
VGNPEIYGKYRWIRNKYVESNHTPTQIDQTQNNKPWYNVGIIWVNEGKYG